MRQFLDDALTASLCTICVAAGLFYLFRSRSVQSLAGVESAGRNRLRGRLRQTNAVVMLLLAASFFWMSWDLNDRNPRARFALLLVGWLLIVMLLLVGADLYLTYRLRRDNRRPRS